MKLRLEAEPGELEAKALSVVRHVASRLAKYDDRLMLVAKALWKAELDGLVKSSTIEFQGMPIVVENPKGSVRHWKDEASGREGETVMQFPYGYVRSTLGADGDGYDCFVGPDPEAAFVWIVHQARPDLGHTQQDARALYDEDKAMLGFSDVHEAVAAYKVHYDDPRFFGSMTQMGLAEFRAKVLATTDPGQDGMLKAVANMPVPERFVTSTTFAKSGLNIALETPPRPIHATSTKLDDIGAAPRAAYEAFVADRDEDRKYAPRRDPKVYEVASLTELPLHPLPEWEQRMITGEEARADAPENLKYVQDKLDRRTAFLREGNPQRLLPRDDRARERYFIRPPETTKSVLPEDLPVPRAKPEEAAKPEYTIDRPAAQTVTVAKSNLGDVTLSIVPGHNGTPVRYDVLIKGASQSFASLSSACDHVWVSERGFPDVATWRAATGRRKVPSGAGWRFWGIAPVEVRP